MITQELKLVLLELLTLIPKEFSDKPIYETNKNENFKLYELIRNATKNNNSFFNVEIKDNKLNDPLFLSSNGFKSLACINVNKQIFCKARLNQVVAIKNSLVAAASYSKSFAFPGVLHLQIPLA